MEKKLQGLLKSAVKSFGDLVHAWRDERNTCFQLLGSLQSLIQTKFSIYKTLETGSKWRNLFVTDNHTDIKERLETILLKDIEITLTSLRESIRDLESLSIAMKLKAEEVWQFVVEIPLDSFGDSCIFDSSHVLEIVDLMNDFYNESERIRLSSTSVLTFALDMPMTALSIESLGKQIEEITSSNLKFGGSENRFKQRVELFIIQNGLEVTSR